MTTAITSIRLCGPLVVEVDGTRVEERLPGRQGGLVVAYLALHRGRPVARHELVELLWPADAPADPGEALAALLSKVRRALGRDAVEGRGELRLALEPGAVIDREQAAGHAAAADRAAATGDWRAALDAAGAARAIAERGFLPGHAGPWLDEQRRSLEELRLGALQVAATAGVALGGGELAAAERAARALVDAAPFRESGHRLLMEALAASGNAAEALRVYDGLRILLRDELGTAPAAEVQALHARLLAGDAGAAPTAAAPSGDAGATPPSTAPSGDAGATPRAPLPRRLAPGERSAFVGRDTELETLRAAWRDARAGTRRLVLVAGPPGIGKTRLTSELAREAHADGTVLYAGVQEDAMVSWPWMDLIGQYARGPGFGAVPVAARPGAAELARLIPELETALPAERPPPPADPETRRFLMFEAVAMLLAQAAGRAPLLVVLDDLHWAARETLDLLRHVVRATGDARLLIVGTYREAEVGPRHPLALVLADLRRERLFERVSLDGLDEPGVGALLASQSGHAASSELAATVHEHTEGNPFFVEEVMRHLVETGGVLERDDRLILTAGAEGVGVPEGVKDVLARRLGRLSEECRTVLAHGSVLGRRFRFDVLAATAGGDEDSVIAALEEAVAAQLVVEVADGLAPGSYAFTHALVRETLYGSLTTARRERMHARAAAAIEAADGEAALASLAVHHRLAGSVGSPERAIDYSLRAGDDARAVAAWDEATAHWTGALDVMTRVEGTEAARAALLVALSDLMVVAGDLSRQIGFLEQALALYEQLGEPVRAAQVHSRLGMAHSLIDSIYAEHLDIERAFRHFDAARAVLDSGPPGKARGHLETGISTAWSYGLRMPEGIEAGERGMEIGERLGDELLWAGAAQACGWHLINAGRLREGLELVRRAFDVADREQRPFLAWMGSNILGQLTWGLAAPDEAQPHFARLLSLPYGGKTAYRQQIADGLGRCHASRGETAEARRLLADAKPAWITHSLKPLLDLWGGHWDHVEAVAANVLATSRRTRNRWDEWAAHHLAARVHHLREELEPAGDRLEEGLAIVVDGGASYFELWARPDLARVRADQGRVDEARAHVERCRAIAGNGEDWRGLAGRVVLAEAVVLAAEGATDAADTAFATARTVLAHHRLRPDEAEALHLWGRVLGVPERLDEALELYRELGAGVPWLERVEADRRRAGAPRP